MPTKKTTPKKKAPATAKAKASASSKQPPTAQPTAAQPTQPTEGLTPEQKVQAQVISNLVAAGHSYQDAVAIVNGDSPQAEAAPPPPVPEPPEPDEPEDPVDDEVEDEEVEETVEIDEDAHLIYAGHGIEKPKDQRHLYDLMEQLEGKRTVTIQIDLKADLFEWLVRMAIAEGQYRGRAEYDVTDFGAQLWREAKAADPTQGGKRNFGTSGPRDLYNPAKGNWQG